MTDPAELIRVAIVDDHPVVREGTAALLGAQPGLRMVGTAASLEEAVPLLNAARVDVLLLDIRLGTDSGLTLLGGGAPRPAVVVLTAYDYPQYAAAAQRLGASGFVVKTAPVAELVAALRTAAAGGQVFARRRPAGGRWPQQRRDRGDAGHHDQDGRRASAPSVREAGRAIENGTGHSCTARGLARGSVASRGRGGVGAAARGSVGRFREPVLLNTTEGDAKRPVEAGNARRAPNRALC